MPETGWARFSAVILRSSIGQGCGAYLFCAGLARPPLGLGALLQRTLSAQVRRSATYAISAPPSSGAIDTSENPRARATTCEGPSACGWLVGKWSSCGACGRASEGWAKTSTGSPQTFAAETGAGSIPLG